MDSSNTPEKTGITSNNVDDTPVTKNTRSGRSARRHRRPPKLRNLPGITSLFLHPVFLGLAGLLIVALLISFCLAILHPEVDGFDASSVLEIAEHQKLHMQDVMNKMQEGVSARKAPADSNINPNINHKHADEHVHAVEKVVAGHAAAVSDAIDPANDVSPLVDGPHLTPRPPLTPFAEIPNGDRLAEDTLNGKPTIAGIAVILNRFFAKLHTNNLQNSKDKIEVPGLIESYFNLVTEILSPFESMYRGKPVFPIREDESIFISLAAFREHLLCQTLESAFDQATNPDALFIGAVVQNCFGNDGRQCRTGLQVVGKNEKGKDQTKQFDAPPDVNGIEEFCSKSQYSKYCDRGQVRALYLHDTDALGPAVARYYASKLWGGETYFMQMDSHLEFAPDWDTKYIGEVKASKNFPKSVLSSYPPGFTDFGKYKGGTPGARLCTCQFSPNGVESHIIRINTGSNCKGDEPRPTQIAFIAAGFFFARAEFLIDVPFDPYVPWCFMGEEIALSMRAWTKGWNIYAPRQNLIAHQYRPGRLGLPKFWESVGRDSGRPGLNTRLQAHVIRRIKHMVGYPGDAVESLVQEGDDVMLTEFEHYSLGTTRTREAYLELTNIDVVAETCGRMPWCSKGELE